MKFLNLLMDEDDDRADGRRNESARSASKIDEGKVERCVYLRLARALQIRSRVCYDGWCGALTARCVNESFQIFISITMRRILASFNFALHRIRRAGEIRRHKENYSKPIKLAGARWVGRKINLRPFRAAGRSDPN
jgi:hypothetical protein